MQSVRFSPNGDLFASGGFDGKMFLYKADDYSKVGEFGNPAHGGGVYAVSLCCKFLNLKTLYLNLI